MLKHSIDGLHDNGAVYICYHLDSNLSNLRRLHAHTKILVQLFHDLLFTDNAALVAHTERALQHQTFCLAKAVQLFELKVSLKNTSIFHQLAALKEYHSPHITVGRTELRAVPQFTYLGCTSTSDAKIDRKVDHRRAKANSAFGRLYKRVLEQQASEEGHWDQCLSSRCMHQPAVWLWVPYHHQIWLLDHFHQQCPRTIFNIHWSNYVNNVEVLEITSIKAMLLKLQLHWAEHISRMGGASPAQDSHVWWTGHHGRWAPKNRFKDYLKKTLSTCHIDYHQWSTLAAAWCLVLHCPLGHLPLSGFLQGNPQVEMLQEEDLRSLSSYTKPDIYYG